MNLLPDFKRPLRIPEHVALCHANPNVAYAGENGEWRIPFTVTRDLPGNTSLRILITGGRHVRGVFTQIDESSLRVIREDNTPIPVKMADGPSTEMMLDLKDQGIRRDETIQLHLRARAPAISLANKMFLLLIPREETDKAVPASNAEKGREVVGACLVHVIGASATRLRAWIPGQAETGSEISILVRPEDANGNMACEKCGDLTARVNGKVCEAHRTEIEGTSCSRLTGIHASEPGVVRIEVEDATHRIKTVTNPCRIVPHGDKNPSMFWGYIHGHTEISDGAGTIDNYFRHMRDTRGLDFGAPADHDHLFETSDEMWEMVQEATARYNKENEFVTFLGYEWAKWRQNGDGDRNVYYFEDGRPMFRSDDGHYPNPPSLFAALKEEKAIIIPHHPASSGNHCDYKEHDPEKERLIEIFGEGMCSERSVADGNLFPGKERKGKTEIAEGFIQRALAMGWRVGFTAGGDDHNGHPGAQKYERMERYKYNAGLFSVLANEKTRTSIWEGLWNRRTVATTGDRILVDFRVNGFPLGSELNVEEHPNLGQSRIIKAAVHGTSPIQSIEVVRNNQDVYAVKGNSLDESLEWEDVESFESIALPPAAHCRVPFCFYYLRVTQENGEMAWASPVWVS